MDTATFRLRVECHLPEPGGPRSNARSGARESVPHQIFFGRRCVVAEEIVDRWHAADHRYLKLRGDDGAVYILRHDFSTNHWELTCYKAAADRSDLSDVNQFDAGSNRLSQAQAKIVV